MAGHLLDTSALLAHYRQEPGADAVHRLLQADDEPLFLSCLSLAEFPRRLVTLGIPATEVQATTEAYAGMMDEILVVDAAIAAGAFHLSQACAERLPLIDALIAATAQSREATLVHRDQHLRGIPARRLRQLVLPDRSGK